jgi:hypothetical protein
MPARLTGWPNGSHLPSASCPDPVIAVPAYSESIDNL